MHIKFVVLLFFHLLLLGRYISVYAYNFFMFNYSPIFMIYDIKCHLFLRLLDKRVRMFTPLTHFLPIALHQNYLLSAPSRFSFVGRKHKHSDKICRQIDEDILDLIASMIVKGEMPGLCTFQDREDGQSVPTKPFVRQRAGNKRRKINKVNDRFNILSFSLSIVYCDADFQRRFRMPKYIFYRMEQDIVGKGAFVARHNDTGRKGIELRTKRLPFLRLLDYGH